jgi:hypothetical protein
MKKFDSVFISSEINESFLDYRDSQTDTNMFVQTFDRYPDFPDATHEGATGLEGLPEIPDKLLAWSAVDKPHQNGQKSSPASLASIPSAHARTMNNFHGSRSMTGVLIRHN